MTWRNRRVMVERCEMCSGRGWKYVSPRRVVAATGSDTSTPARVKAECLGCVGTGGA